MYVYFIPDGSIETSNGLQMDHSIARRAHTVMVNVAGSPEFPNSGSAPYIEIVKSRLGPSSIIQTANVPAASKVAPTFDIENWLHNDNTAAYMKAWVKDGIRTLFETTHDMGATVAEVTIRDGGTFADVKFKMAEGNSIEYRLQAGENAKLL